MAINIERALERLWAEAAATIPDWLPMRYIEWLPAAYDVALSLRAAARGRSNIYLVLLGLRGQPRRALRRVRGNEQVHSGAALSISTRGDPVGG